MDDLILYVLVRTDMDSMRYGKGAAQVGHACNQFTDDWIIKPLLSSLSPDADAMIWRDQANGFGTTFTLAVPSLLAMLDTVDAAETLGFKAGSVVDPTYPFLVPNEMVNRLNTDILTAPTLSYGRDRSLCFAQETTTAYIFGKKAALSVLLARYDPLPNE
jgi:hypothetical protein